MAPPLPHCPHLQLLRDASPDPFCSLHRCLRSRPYCGRAELLRGPLDVPLCHFCPHARAHPRLYACLSCPSLLCPVHAPSHPHPLSVDVDRAELFCAACRDQIYDPAVDSAVLLSRPLPPLDPSPRKRARKAIAEYRPWAPTPREQHVLSLGSTPLRCVEGIPGGLRGLNNLGSTCFMNSVLQALLHTPPLRNYFLSDRHNLYVCTQRKAGVQPPPPPRIGSGLRESSGRSGGGTDADRGKSVCLVCDLDAIYSAAFSGTRAPYSPAKFLYSWWQHASNLASYEQQDAHEFFISILDGIHEKLGRDQRKVHTQGSGDCCIAHRVFSGILRSDVTCTVCGFTSTTYDPCIDISLNLDSVQHPSRVSQNSNYVNNDKDPSVCNNTLSTLVGCLEHFTKPERLGSDQKLFCQQCQLRQESLKQMSVRKLPLVTCFHIKRFEHSTSRKVSRKVDRYLQFPFSLDMGPYLSSSILRSRFGNRMVSFDSTDDHSSPTASEFELFAVITHSGRLESGHYATFLRLRNQWYKCDDAWIVQVGETVVRAAQAYMLFYVQKVLYYKAKENL